MNTENEHFQCQCFVLCTLYDVKLLRQKCMIGSLSVPALDLLLCLLLLVNRLWWKFTLTILYTYGLFWQIRTMTVLNFMTNVSFSLYKHLIKENFRKYKILREASNIDSVINFLTHWIACIHQHTENYGNTYTLKTSKGM